MVVFNFSLLCECFAACANLSKSFNSIATSRRHFRLAIFAIVGALSRVLSRPLSLQGLPACLHFPLSLIAINQLRRQLLTAAWAATSRRATNSFNAFGLLRLTVGSVVLLVVVVT